jgi:hypothetical protein
VTIGVFLKFEFACVDNDSYGKPEGVPLQHERIGHGLIDP